MVFIPGFLSFGSLFRNNFRIIKIIVWERRFRVPGGSSVAFVPGVTSDAI
jgi:hypothetical protein